MKRDLAAIVAAMVLLASSTAVAQGDVPAVNLPGWAWAGLIGVLGLGAALLGWALHTIYQNVLDRIDRGFKGLHARIGHVAADVQDLEQRHHDIDKRTTRLEAKGA